MIRSSNLQRIQSSYPPTPGTADYFTYTLFVILDGRIHAVTWTDTSPNAPEELFKIAQVIENLRSTAWARFINNLGVSPLLSDKQFVIIFDMYLGKFLRPHSLFDVGEANR